VLCFGNELLGDDALGCVVADRVQPFASEDVEILCTSESGFYLLDCVLGVRRLVVVDTVQTGNVGLCEALALARELGLPAAEEVIILAVEVADCLTMGAEMSPQARTALPVLLSMIRGMMPAATASSTD
jgi:Ni,Fe-hydrogenase maturation factor